MDSKTHARLLHFHFGSINEQERIEIERELLTDPEVLVDYLDVKRELEAAAAIPAGPSHHVLARLQARFQPRKKLIFAWSLGTALTAGLIFGGIFLFQTKAPTASAPALVVTPQGTLFDTNHELPGNWNVL